MLGWLGLIGSFVDFFAKKLLGRQLDLALDKKRTACRALVELHNVLAEFETISTQFANAIEPIANGGKVVLYPFWIKHASDRLENATAKFKTLTPELLPALTVLDPELAEMVVGISRGKKGGLYRSGTSAFGAMEFKINWKDESKTDYSTIRFNLPNRIPTFDDWNNQLQTVSTRAHATTIVRDADMPNDLLLELVKATSKEFEVRATEVGPIIELYASLVDHVDVLKNARCLLAQFLSRNFKIEDILSQRVG